MLFNAKRMIKEKEKEIESLKQISVTEAKIESTNSIGNNDVKSSKEMEKGVIKGKSKEKRIMSKSAQKYRRQGTGGSETKSNCQEC